MGLKIAKGLPAYLCDLLSNEVQYSTRTRIVIAVRAITRRRLSLRHAAAAADLSAPNVCWTTSSVAVPVSSSVWRTLDVACSSYSREVQLQTEGVPIGIESVFLTTPSYVQWVQYCRVCVCVCLCECECECGCECGCTSEETRKQATEKARRSLSGAWERSSRIARNCGGDRPQSTARIERTQLLMHSAPANRAVARVHSFTPSGVANWSRKKKRRRGFCGFCWKRW